jgi:hypothetical protein
MFWGAICEGFSPGPFRIWEKETPEEKQLNALILYNENKENQCKIQTDRQQARVSGTTQNRVLQELNAEVDRLNREQPLPSGYKRR